MDIHIHKRVILESCTARRSGGLHQEADISRQHAKTHVPQCKRATGTFPHVLWECNLCGSNRTLDYVYLKWECHVKKLFCIKIGVITWSQQPFLLMITTGHELKYSLCNCTVWVTLYCHFTYRYPTPGGCCNSDRLSYLNVYNEKKITCTGSSMQPLRLRFVLWAFHTTKVWLTPYWALMRKQPLVEKSY